jgi:hypothetical protein
VKKRKEKGKVNLGAAVPIKDNLANYFPFLKTNAKSKQ